MTNTFSKIGDINIPSSLANYVECGYHSLRNPLQKQLPAERRHKYERGYETVFYWDDYSKHDTLEESFNKFLKQEG